MAASTKDRLIEAGMALLLERGYHHVGIQDLLDATSVPKGSFYHHFESKEDFALEAVDRYMAAVHAGLDACLDDPTRPPLERIRRFFDAVRDSYRKEGYLGCLLGGLGQELAGVSDVFRRRIEDCMSFIATRLAGCLEEAIRRGDVARGTDARHFANLLVNAWEGAALRSRLLREPAPLGEMLDFYFEALPKGAGARTAAAAPASPPSGAPRARAPAKRRAPLTRA